MKLSSFICAVPPQCEHGKVQLAGGASDREGRVEVCVLGRWSTICDGTWQKADATVVCHQLGFDLETTGKSTKTSLLGFAW